MEHGFKDGTGQLVGALHAGSQRTASAPATTRSADPSAPTEADVFPWLRQLETSGIDVSIMVPCYNEEDNVVGTLETVTAAMAQVGCTYEVIVIDDCSRDETSARVKEYQAQHPATPIRLHRNKINRGLARNFFDGAFMARGRFYRLVCGDNVEPVETIVTVLRQRDSKDIVIPFHVEAQGRSAGRLMLSGLFTKVVNLLSGHSLHYYNGCPLFRTFHVMRWHVETTGFGFQAEFITRILDLGATYVEVPATTRERTSGKSRALTLRNWMSAGYTLQKVGFRTLRRKLFGESETGLF